MGDRYVEHELMHGAWLVGEMLEAAAKGARERGLIAAHPRLRVALRKAVDAVQNLHQEAGQVRWSDNAGHQSGVIPLVGRRRKKSHG